MDEREQAIKAWMGAASDALNALESFRMALEYWQDNIADDDDFMSEYMLLDRVGLEGWADGLSDPSIDDLRDLVTGKRETTAIFGEGER